MAHLHTNVPDPSGYSQNYYPLGNLPSTNNGSNILRPDASGASRHNSTEAFVNNEPYSYSADEGRLNHDASRLTESDPAAQYPHDKSTQNVYTNELVSNPISERKKFSVRDWQWEFSAAAFSLGCFAAVVGVLITYDTKSLSTWNFAFGITLNTLIATISTLSRTSLLVPVASCLSQLKWIHIVTASRSLNEIQIFDDASRGPWGSLELIWRLHIKTKLATWGAVITILALAMDPFAQQLLSYPSRPIYSDAATFYASQVYDSSPGDKRVTRGPRNQDSTMGARMQGAILNGLFNLKSPIDVTCPGDCQWKAFSTLAVKSTCQNVTSTSRVNCKFDAGSRFCNYTTPSGLMLQGSSWSSSGGGGALFFNTTARNMSPTPQRGEPANSTILNIAMSNMQGDFNLTHPDLIQCEMRWCARVTRNLSVTNGTFNPGVSEDIELKGLAPDTTRQIGINQVEWYPFNVTDDHPSFSGNRTFNIHGIDYLGIRQFLKDIFTTNKDGPFYLPLMSSMDRAGTVDSIAQSMTYELGRGPSGTKLKGTVTSSEQYIHVNWLWIILPFAEIVMAIAFMACTLIYNQRMGVTVWKSSSIVPLLSVLVGWDNKELGATSLRDLNKRSTHMKGQLVPNGGSVQGLYRKE